VHTSREVGREAISVRLALAFQALDHLSLLQAREVEVLDTLNVKLSHDHGVSSAIDHVGVHLCGELAHCEHKFIRIS